MDAVRYKTYTCVDLVNQYFTYRVNDEVAKQRPFPCLFNQNSGKARQKI